MGKGEGEGEYQRNREVVFLGQRDRAGKIWSLLARIVCHRTETGSVNMQWDAQWPGHMQWHAPTGGIRWQTVGWMYEKAVLSPMEGPCLRGNC